MHRANRQSVDRPWWIWRLECACRGPMDWESLNPGSRLLRGPVCLGREGSQPCDVPGDLALCRPLDSSQCLLRPGSLDTVDEVLGYGVLGTRFLGTMMWLCLVLSRDLYLGCTPRFWHDSFHRRCLSFDSLAWKVHVEMNIQGTSPLAQLFSSRFVSDPLQVHIPDKLS